MARQRKETAAAAYRARATEIETLMEAIGEALDAHHRAHDANPENWGLVGEPRSRA